MQNLEISIPNRFGPLSYGMNPAEVRKLLQETEVYEDWMGGNRNDSILLHCLIIEFDRCDGRGPLPDSRFVGAIIRLRPDVTLLGEPLFSLTREQTMEYLRQAKITFVEHAGGSFYSKTHGFSLEFNADNSFEYIDIFEPDTSRPWPKSRPKM